MKKFIAIILCLAMMIPTAVISTFATAQFDYDSLPVIDGEVKADEYTNSKIYDHANYFSANCFKDGQVVTEYVAHDADYVYFALTYNVDLKSCTIRMNGRADVKTDLAASEYVYEFQFEFGSDMDTAELTLVEKDFQDVEGFNEENEDEAQGKASKIFEGGKVIATHFEIKILKEAMKRVFEVDSIDYFGYYAKGTTPDPFEYIGTTALSNIVNSAKFNSLNGNDAYGNWTDTPTDIISTYDLDGTNYFAKYRFMNFVVFGEEPAMHNIYCPAGDSCICTRHAERAEVMDLTDTVNLGTLKSNYVTKMIVTTPTPITTEYTATAPIQSSIKDQTLPVKANYSVGEIAPDTYSVDLSFGSMEFTYEANLNSNWNADSHQYEAGEGAWVCEGGTNKISVTNHSNVGIKAAFSYAQESGYTNINGSFGSKSAFTLDSAVGTIYENAPTDSTYLTLSGEYSGNEEFVQVGSVTITISKK
ncbi:MAG: hypothetical protein E7679_01050 [Ruminococcaceae bacterium]|nr:hypothetical protein [Oscillospiraceae bacterium]